MKETIGYWLWFQLKILFFLFICTYILNIHRLLHSGSIRPHAKKNSSSSQSSYVQIPTPDTGLHEAMSPHCASLLMGLHMSAQNLFPVLSWSAQVGVAVTPIGTSSGQEVPMHSGVQKSPETPEIWMASSSARHPLGLGSS
jgi:hypothetical protein